MHAAVVNCNKTRTCNIQQISFFLGIGHAPEGIFSTRL